MYCSTLGMLLLSVTSLVPQRRVFSGLARRSNAARVPMEMRYGKKQIKIRTTINKLVNKAEDVEAIADVMSSLLMERANWRLRARLMTKIRRRAYAMGYQVGFYEGDGDDFDVDMPEDLAAAFQGIDAT